VTEVKATAVPAKKTEKVAEAKPKATSKQIEIKPVEVKKPKEVKTESKPKKVAKK
jgi:hypothetical protein